MPSQDPKIQRVQAIERARATQRALRLRRRTQPAVDRLIDEVLRALRPWGHYQRPEEWERE